MDYSYAGHSAAIKPQIVDMAMNASGIRDTARVLHVSPTTVIKADALEVRRGLSSELDEMWSFVQAKAHPRWLWHAIDHHTGKVLAYVFGRRKDTVFLKLQQLLEPFGITKFYTDGWGAYERHIDAKQHQVGKEHTQKIESKHINLRTRKVCHRC
jgi:insertion element IS1 protein InsB